MFPPIGTFAFEEFSNSPTLNSNGLIPLSKVLPTIAISLLGASMDLSLSNSSTVTDSPTKLSSIPETVLLLISIAGTSMDNGPVPF